MEGVQSTVSETVAERFRRLVLECSDEHGGPALPEHSFAPPEKSNLDYRVLTTPFDVPAPFTDLGYAAICDKPPKWFASARFSEKPPTFHESFNECQRLGVHFRPSICIENGTGRFLVGGSQEVVEKVVIIVNGTLFPMCTQGLNRSPGVYRVASKQIDSDSLALPHGVVRGFDNCFSEELAIADAEDPLEDIVGEGLGMVARPGRLGEGQELSVEDFEKTYWVPMITKGGTIIVIGKAIYGVLLRLLQVAGKHTLSLHKIHIQPFDRKDPYNAPPSERKDKVFHYITAINHMIFKLAEEEVDRFGVRDPSPSGPHAADLKSVSLGASNTAFSVTRLEGNRHKDEVESTVKLDSPER